MGTPLDDAALDVIFRQARTQNKWLDKPVSERPAALYDLAALGPTSANCFPVRIAFVTSLAAKERLKPLVFEGNRQKIMSAPATAILGFDTKFYDWLPRLFPHMDARAWFIDKPAFAEATAFRNSLQGAYFIIAARSRAGLRADVRLRQRGGRQGVLPRRAGEVKLPVCHWLRRSGGRVRASASSDFQRGVLNRLNQMAEPRV